MSIQPGTLAGYDQLLTISQEAINRQLEVLYATEVDPPIENGPRYLINREFNFHPTGVTQTGKTYVEERGLEAYTYCPRIDFSGRDVAQEHDRTRTAIIKFKFRKAEAWELEEQGKRANSVMIYESKDVDARGRLVPVYPEVVLDGWELSWEVLVDQRNIQNVMEEIIKPAESSTSNVSLAKPLKTTLKGVDTSCFQVSTIFCAMQSARLIRSFKLVDQNGQQPEELVNNLGNKVPFRIIKEKLMETLCEKFIHNPIANSSKPTPDNPFVLGYTISQQRSELMHTNPAAYAANTKPFEYFIPASFRCTLSPGNQWSGGTLNYCMMTNREDGEVPRALDYASDGAGRFEDNVFARMKSRAVPGSCEGGLFFARDIFVNHWIAKAVAPRFFLRPGAACDKIGNLVKDNYKHFNFAGMWTFANDIPANTISTVNNVYEMKNEFKSGRKIIALNEFNDPTESVKLEFRTRLHISYNNLHGIYETAEDEKRRLKFTIGSYTFIKIKFFRRTALNHVLKFYSDGLTGAKRTLESFLGDEGWEEAYDVNQWLNLIHTFEIGTSAKNSGSLEIFHDQSRSEHLNANKQLSVYEGMKPADPEETAPGAFRYTHAHNWASVFSEAFKEEFKNLVTIGEGTAKNGAELFTAAINDLVKSLGSTVILPAGDVFMFKGLGVDEQDNIFTSVTYNTPIGGDVKLVQGTTASNQWLGPSQP